MKAYLGFKYQHAGLSANEDAEKYSELTKWQSKINYFCSKGELTDKKSLRLLNHELNEQSLNPFVQQAWVRHAKYMEERQVEIKQRLLDI